MDTKIEIKEGDPLLDDTASQNEIEFFNIKTNCDAELFDNISDVEIKTDIKSETPFPDIFSQKERECFPKHLIKQIMSETVTSSNNHEISIKTEIEEQTLVSDFGSHNKREFLPEDPVMKVKKYNDHQVDNKIEIKEEPWWLEMETPSVCDDIKNRDFTPVNSPRLFLMENVAMPARRKRAVSTNLGCQRSRNLVYHLHDLQEMVCQHIEVTSEQMDEGALRPASQQPKFPSV